MYKYILFIFIILFTPHVQSENGIKVFPETCYDLLPDYGEYVAFLEDMGALWSYSSTFYAKEIFKLLAIRDLYQKNNIENNNPVNNEIKQLLCKCRIKIKDNSITASSYDMKICLKKQLSKTIKTSSEYYKSLMSKKSILSKSVMDRHKYQIIIDRLKQSALNDIQYLN